MRHWVSWICTEDDHRPITFPPGVGVLGWWCSGYDPDDNAVLCALVEGQPEQVIKADWPEFDGVWRFCEQTADEWRPGDRFPLSEWMVPRVEGR